jgi:hypothetical protein
MTTEGTEEKHEDTEKVLYRRVPPRWAGAEAAERVLAEMHRNR